MPTESESEADINESIKNERILNAPEPPQPVAVVAAPAPEFEIEKPLEKKESIPMEDPQNK